MPCVYKTDVIKIWVTTVIVASELCMIVLRYYINNSN